MRWYFQCYTIKAVLLKYQTKILVATCRLPVDNMVGKHKILQTYNKSEEMLTECPVFLQILRFCSEF